MLPVLVHASYADCPPFPALLHEQQALALTHWSDDLYAAPLSFEALLRQWALLESPLRDLCEAPDTTQAIAHHGVPLETLKLHAPVAPTQVYCTIGNYRAQLIEAALDAEDGPCGAGATARREAVLTSIEQRRRSGQPYVCLKGRGSLAGPYDPLRLTPDLATLDWEVELGVVIGKPTWQVPTHEALDYVAGYCVVNDLTLRDRIFREDVQVLGTDWVQSKSRPGWLPAGPWLVPAWNVTDPSALQLNLRLNGEQMQHGVSDDMVFGVAEQIAYLSHHIRLEAGDLLCTGSPAGFGSHHRRFLRPGDMIEAEIDGLGIQRVRCEAA